MIILKTNQSSNRNFSRVKLKPSVCSPQTLSMLSKPSVCSPQWAISKPSVCSPQTGHELKLTDPCYHAQHLLFSTPTRSTATTAQHLLFSTAQHLLLSTPTPSVLHDRPTPSVLHPHDRPTPLFSTPTPSVLGVCSPPQHLLFSIPPSRFVLHHPVNIPEIPPYGPAYVSLSKNLAQYKLFLPGSSLPSCQGSWRLTDTCTFKDNAGQLVEEQQVRRSVSEQKFGGGLVTRDRTDHHPTEMPHIFTHFTSDSHAHARSPCWRRGRDTLYHTQTCSIIEEKW